MSFLLPHIDIPARKRRLKTYEDNEDCKSEKYENLIHPHFLNKLINYNKFIVGFTKNQTQSTME